VPARRVARQDGLQQAAFLSYRLSRGVSEYREEFDSEDLERQTLRLSIRIASSAIDGQTEPILVKIYSAARIR
jgi:hypothetical protein